MHGPKNPNSKELHLMSSSRLGRRTFSWAPSLVLITKSSMIQNYSLLKKGKITKENDSQAVFKIKLQPIKTKAHDMHQALTTK